MLSTGAAVGAATALQAVAEHIKADAVTVADAWRIAEERAERFRETRLVLARYIREGDVVDYCGLPCRVLSARLEDPESEVYGFELVLQSLFGGEPTEVWFAGGPVELLERA